MKTKAFIFKMLFVLMLAFVLSACGASSTPAETLSPRLQEIKANGQLVVGTAMTAPFEYHDPQTGELVGLDVEIAKTLAAKIGVPIVWKEMAFADLIPTLEQGKVDLVIAGMYITDARKEIVDMTNGYVDTGLVAVGAVAGPNYATPQELAGKIVCVKTGSTGAKYAQKLLDEGVTLEMREYADTVSSLEDISAGFCDVAFNDKTNSLEYIKTHPDLKVASEVFQPAQIGAAVRKGDAELLAFINAEIEAMQTDGRLDTLYNKWVLGK